MPTSPTDPTRLARPAAQRGAAALIVTLLLAFATVLAAAWVNRNLVFEARTSANQYRSTQAFEAAQAGLEWAIAHVNDDAGLDAACAASTDPGAGSFRTRYLAFTPATSAWSGRTWNAAGTATPLRPVCTAGAGGWACSCPVDGPASLASGVPGSAVPTFAVQFSAGPQAGTVRVVATGCSRAAAPCVDAGAATAEASARVEVLLALASAVRTSPAAALTVRGSVAVGSASLGLHNADPATGLALDAGGNLAGTAVRITAPAGSAAGDALVTGDAALAATDPARLFAAYFGLAPADWKQLPTVRRIDCSSACGNEVIAAAGPGGRHALVWVEGDLALDGPLALGSVERPVVLVVNGELTITGAAQIHGLVYASRIVWNGATSGAWLRGAAVSTGDFLGDARTELWYDTAVLTDLRRHAGTFTRVAGSWRDF